MERDHYRFAMVDEALALMQSMGLIDKLTDGYIPFKDPEDEDYDPQLGKHEDYEESFSDPDTFCCFLPFADPDAPSSGLSIDGRVFLPLLPKRLVLQLLEMEKEDLPKGLVMIRQGIEDGSWNTDEGQLPVAARALIRRISADRSSWDSDPKLRRSVGEFAASFLYLRLEGRL